MTIHVGGGGSGGGSDPNMTIGANFQTFAQIPDAPATVTFSLDPAGNATQHWLNGFTLNAGKDGLIAPRKGRYLVTVASEIGMHPTDWNRVRFGAAGVPFTGLEQDPTFVVIPPRSTADFGSGNGLTAVYMTYTELDVGSVLSFFASQWLAPGTTHIFVADAYCQAQYVGPATSI